MLKLQISLDRRRFIKENGDPFIWIADTAWTMPQRMKWDDVDYYMKKRKQQGFTLLQIVALDPERDVEIRNPAGEKALYDSDLLKPREAYFTYLDYILKKAEDYGFYVLLLPVWGQLVVGDNWMGEHFKKVVTEENAYQYGAWIGNRYKDKKNVLWCLGGDRMPIHKGNDYKNVWRKMAEGLAKGVLGNSGSVPYQHILLTQSAASEQEINEHRQACFDPLKKQLCVYFPQGGSERIDISIFESVRIYYTWFNPKKGECTPWESLEIRQKSTEFIAPGQKMEEDWVLVACTARDQIAIKHLSYGESQEQEKAKKVFNW